MQGTIELATIDKDLRYKMAVQMMLTTKIMRIKG